MKKFLNLCAILTLLFWGGLFLYFYASGRIEKHLDASFRIYALVAGVGMILLAGFNLLTRHIKAGDCQHDHDHHDHEHKDGCCGHDLHDHEHTHRHDHKDGCCGHDEESGHAHAHSHEETNSGLTFTLLILLVPALVAAKVSTDTFSPDYIAKWGKIERQMMVMRNIQQSRTSNTSTNPYTSAAIEAADAAAKSGTGEPAAPDAVGNQSEPENNSWGAFTIDDLKKMVPQSSDGDFLLDVPQIFYTAGDRELMNVMEGIAVETTAQVMEETLNNPDNTRLKAFRVFVECCAADGRPLSIPIDFGQPVPEYKQMGWYKIFGKIHYASEMDGLMPLIQVERMEETTAPDAGILY